MTSQELEDRLIAFGIRIIKLTERIPKTPAGRHLSEQILRSGTSPALNYAEARAAETHRDFTHKIKIVLKELRETHCNLRLIAGTGLHPDKDEVNDALVECSESVAIFTSSVKTAENKSPRRTS